MINWIIGGIIFGATVLIIVRSISRMKKGESGCCGCTQSKCNCAVK
ncbi:FeoB-associated Cys-rich membrane protein [Desulfosporosinus nitroreducens]|nr:FeoB-associated Cys-rich membrane protein [Desulfosporosinus nitroreducens]MCO1600534.1 FeoB-associated Cys-rich membrane protein [Desulfosporosinus nitroreducens]